MGYKLFGYDIESDIPLIKCSAFDIFIFLVILIAGIIVVKIISILLQGSFKKAKVDKVLSEFLTRLVRIILYIFVVGLALGFVGINLGAVLVSVSVVLGLVLGFALGDTLSNVASGVMLAVTKIFKEGDFVEVAGRQGFIKHVGITITEMDTTDNKRIFIPNKMVWSADIVNFTKNKTRRVDMTVGVSYSDDLDKVLKVTTNIVKNHPLVLKDPEPQIVVSEMADSSITITIRPWSKTEDYWTVFFDLKKGIKQGYDKAGISIPFPQRDIHLIDKSPPPK